MAIIKLTDSVKISKDSLEIPSQMAFINPSNVLGTYRSGTVTYTATQNCIATICGSDDSKRINNVNITFGGYWSGNSCTPLLLKQGQKLDYTYGGDHEGSIKVFGILN